MRSLGAVTVGATVANVAAYLVAIPASRSLGAVDYGVFGIVMAAMVVVAAPSMAVQAVIAREVVHGRTDVKPLAVRTAVLVATFAVVAGMILVPILRIPVAAATAGLVMAPLIVLTAAGQGILQGHGEFGRLGWLLALVGVLRAGPMIVAVLLDASAVGALWAGAAGTLAAALLSWRWANLPQSSESVGSEGVLPSAPAVSEDFGTRAGVLDVLGASQVQLALLVAVSLDLLLARVVLSETDAGLYALGAVVTKAAFWLPQAVGTVVYPRLAAPGSTPGSLRKAFGVVTGIGAVVVGATWVGAPLVPHVVGAEYRPIVGILWVFAAAGAVFAVLALLLLAVIAVRRTVIGIAVWVLVAGQAAAILAWAHSVATLVGIAAVSATIITTVCVAALALGSRSSRRASPSAGAGRESHSQSAGRRG